MRLLLAALLAAWTPWAARARAAEVAKPGLIRGVPAAASALSPAGALPVLPAALSLPSVGGVNIPALPLANALLPAGPDLRLDPGVRAAMANPVPVTAMGLHAVNFTAPAAPRAVAAAAALTASQGRSAVPASALDSGRRVAAAFQDASSPSATADVSSLVFDGARVSAASPVRAPVRYAAPAAPPARGSDPLSGLSGVQLLRALHELSGRGYKAKSYDEAKSYLFSTADQVVVNGRRGVVDAYSGIFEPGTSGNGGSYGEHGDENHDGRVDDKGMNVEHIWPQSFFAKLLPMRSDLHHLMATFIYPNGVRGNLPFGEVRGRGDYSNDAGARRGQGVFEPPDAVKGRVARALLYFYTRYHDRNITNGAFGDAFWNSKLEMILRWNRQFPPTDWERARNDAVERFQGNRNPFVDDPSLADRIGVEGFRRVPALRFQDRARIARRLRR